MSNEEGYFHNPYLPHAGPGSDPRMPTVEGMVKGAQSLGERPPGMEGATGEGMVADFKRLLADWRAVKNPDRLRGMKDFKRVAVALGIVAAVIVAPVVKKAMSGGGPESGGRTQAAQVERAPAHPGLGR